MPDFDAGALQFSSRPDARQHQKLWRIDCTAGQQNLAAGVGQMADAVTLIANAGRAVTLKLELERERAGTHGEVGTRACRAQVANSSRTTSAAFLGDLIKTEPALARAIEIPVDGKSGLFCGLDEDFAQGIEVRQVFDAQRPPDPVQVRGAP